MKSKFAAALLSISTLTTPATAQETSPTFSYISTELTACFNGDRVIARLDIETNIDTEHSLGRAALLNIPKQTDAFRGLLNQTFQKEINNAKTNPDTITIMDRFIAETVPRMLQEHFRQTTPDYINSSSTINPSNKNWIIDGCVLGA